MVDDTIVAVILVTILGSAIAYIVRAKKRGQKCIGCPDGCNCGKSGGCSGSCGGCDH